MASPDCVTHKTLKHGTVEWCALCWEFWGMEHEYMEELVTLRHELDELKAHHRSSHIPSSNPPIETRFEKSEAG